MLAACGSPSAPTVGDRPSQPTLSISPVGSAGSGRRIVAVASIAQAWHVGKWLPASITLPDVEPGDAIVVAGMYWADVERGAPLAPTDDRGELVPFVEQATAVVGRRKPPVFVHGYVELAAPPGQHVITPPYLGGPAGDGTMYVVQIRGLTEQRVIASAQNRLVAFPLTAIAVALQAASEPDDLAIALGGYDNAAPRVAPGWSAAGGWNVVASQDDAANNVPSVLYSRLGGDRAEWRWADPTVNVAAALIIAVR
jgi:hypothetical protein